MLGLFRKNGEDVIKRLEGRMDNLRLNLEDAYLAKDAARTEMLRLKASISEDNYAAEYNERNAVRKIIDEKKSEIDSLNAKIEKLTLEVKTLTSNHAVDIARITADTEVAQITYKARIKQELNDKYEAENSSLKDTIQEITADRSNYHGLYEGALLVIQSLEEQLAGQMSLIESLIGKTPSVDVKVSTPTTIAGQIIEKTK